MVVLPAREPCLGSVSGPRGALRASRLKLYAVTGRGRGSEGTTASAVDVPSSASSTSTSTTSSFPVELSNRTWCLSCLSVVTSAPGSAADGPGDRQRSGSSSSSARTAAVHMAARSAFHGLALAFWILFFALVGLAFCCCLCGAGSVVDG